jgi:hypothetical protein
MRRCRDNPALRSMSPFRDSMARYCVDDATSVAVRLTLGRFDPFARRSAMTAICAERSSTAFSTQDDLDGVVDLARHRDGDDRQQRHRRGRPG